MYYAIYKYASGIIDRMVDCPSTMITNQVEFDEGSVTAALDVTPDDHYFNFNALAITPRNDLNVSWDKTAIVSNGVDVATATGTLTNLTVSVLRVWGDIEHEEIVESLITNDEIIVSSTIAGHFEITIDSGDFTDKIHKQIIDAT